MSPQPPEEPTRDDAAVADDASIADDAAVADETSAEGAPGPAASGPRKTWGTVPSTNRVVLWVIVGGIGLYLVGSGIIGILVP